MQRGRFAQEFLAELLREPRALRLAHLSERTRWHRQLKVGGRETLLFELEMLLRAVERGFARRHEASDERPLLGQDFTPDLLALRDALRRASAVARRLTTPDAERGFQFRRYLERLHAERKREPLTRVLVDQRTPEESLFLLRQGLQAAQGLADLALRPGSVSFQTFAHVAVLGEQVILGSRYFRPPGVLEFRAEYDRVGSVRLLELVRRIQDERARKSLALSFLACFRLLRYLRFVPRSPAALPRRTLLLVQLVRDEAAVVASYLEGDLPRLTAGDDAAREISLAAQRASESLLVSVREVDAALALGAFDRAQLDLARSSLSEGAKAAAGHLALAVEPGANVAELFDGQRTRRDRAVRLRGDLWILGQMLRAAMEDLFPAMRGEPAAPGGSVAALVRFCAVFRQLGFHLLRHGDHDPFERFFASLKSLAGAAPSTLRDRSLYLDCRSFLVVVERTFALVSRRTELFNVPLEVEALTLQIEQFRSSDEAEPAADEASLASQLLTCSDEEHPLPEEDPEALALAGEESMLDTTRRIWRGR